ncbi:MAG TPA: dihydrolipoamide acetyltransferase family protein [Chloroflexota bacterium]
MAEFRMPSLGADMQDGTVVEWRVKSGDAVKRGDVVGVVDTDKGAIEIEIFESGVIDRLLVPVGERVPVGTVLALVRHGRVAPAAAVAAPPEAHPRVSPLARRIAADLHVDLGKVTGSGPGGAINRADVERASVTLAPAPVSNVAAEAPSIAASAEAPSPATPLPAAPAREAGSSRQAAMRRAIAAAMSRSNRDIPHYYLETTIDMQRSLAWLSEANAHRSVEDRVLPAVLLLKAVALAVHEVPEVNGFWLEDQLQPSEAIHLGVAISLRTGGLVTPAIHDTDTLSLETLNAALKDVVQRSRAGSLRSSELSDATLTVTNLGDQGVDKVLGVIYPPQVALVGFGAIKPRPWAVDGLLGVRPTLIATLAGDHRATDGHRGGRFLAAIDRLLQKPEGL